MYYVYILNCSDNKPYTGCTENLEERLKRHDDGHISGLTIVAVVMTRRDVKSSSI